MDLLYGLYVQVEPIVDSVRQRGDAAVKELTEKFDSVRLDSLCCPIDVRTCLLPCLQSNPQRLFVLCLLLVSDLSVIRNPSWFARSMCDSFILRCHTSKQIRLAAFDHTSAYSRSIYCMTAAQ